MGKKRKRPVSAEGRAESLTLRLKLASMVIHVQEALGTRGHMFDVEALRGLAEDREVKDWIAGFDKALLPVKR